MFKIFNFFTMILKWSIKMSHTFFSCLYVIAVTYLLTYNYNPFSFSQPEISFLFFLFSLLLSFVYHYFYKLEIKYYKYLFFIKITLFGHTNAKIFHFMVYYCWYDISNVCCLLLQVLQLSLTGGIMPRINVCIIV